MRNSPSAAAWRANPWAISVLPSLGRALVTETVKGRMSALLRPLSRSIAKRFKLRWLKVCVISSIRGGAVAICVGIDIGGIYRVMKVSYHAVRSIIWSEAPSPRSCLELHSAAVVRSGHRAPCAAPPILHRKSSQPQELRDLAEHRLHFAADGQYTRAVRQELCRKKDRRDCSRLRRECALSFLKAAPAVAARRPRDC